MRFFKGLINAFLIMALLLSFLASLYHLTRKDYLTSIIFLVFSALVFLMICFNLEDENI